MKTVKKSGSHAGHATNSKVDLGAIRSNFDGLKDVAAKIPEGAVKTSIMTGIENLYLKTVNLFGFTDTPTPA